MNRRWTALDLESKGKAQPTAFEAAYQTVMGDEEIFFLFHGGVTVEYMPALSTSLRIGPKVPHRLGPAECVLSLRLCT